MSHARLMHWYDGTAAVGQVASTSKKNPTTKTTSATSAAEALGSVLLTARPPARAEDPQPVPRPPRTDRAWYGIEMSVTTSRLHQIMPEAATANRAGITGGQMGGWMRIHDAGREDHHGRREQSRDGLTHALSLPITRSRSAGVRTSRRNASRAETTKSICCGQAADGEARCSSGEQEDYTPCLSAYSRYRQNGH